MDEKGSCVRPACPKPCCHILESVNFGSLGRPWLPFFSSYRFQRSPLRMLPFVEPKDNCLMAVLCAWFHIQHLCHNKFTTLIPQRVHHARGLNQHLATLHNYTTARTQIAASNSPCSLLYSITSRAMRVNYGGRGCHVPRRSMIRDRQHERTKAFPGRIVANDMLISLNMVNLVVALTKMA